ncbi:hypothetical protein [Corynebacterium dentalis]|uniref:hypothetical protein n=1 Tax=Corynebacterium dentalis TaxID=2014528 RepID=UPI002899171B|nr:hypothetical protein [Corynebacterium dentalis]
MSHTPPTSATSGTSPAEAPEDNVSTPATNVEIIKGNVTDTQRAALEQVVDSVAEAVEREKNVKPNPRGHYGTPLRQRATNTANPTGFRTAPLP